MAWLAGCQDYGLTSSCQDDAQCQPGQICVEQRCRDGYRPCQGPEDCAPGLVCGDDGVCGHCRADGDCPAGQTCQEGLCQSPACRVDDDCPPGELCLEDACQACDCRQDEDCGFFLVCRACACELPTRPCETAADCLPFELCLEGECTLPSTCQTDQDCPDGTVCNGLFCEAGCQADADCGTLRACVGGRCLMRCLSDQTCFQPGTICQDFVCVPAECLGDQDCAGPLTRCLGGRCTPYTPCQSDPDCLEPGFVCRAGICEELPRCSLDATCGSGAICEQGHCVPVAACLTEADCGPAEDCVGGLCRPHVCRGPEDCPPPTVCSGGACLEPANPASVYQVVVLTPGGPIRPGQRIRLVALALNQAGDALSGVRFAWTSSDPPRAAVEDQELVGGAEAGATLVIAEALGSGRRSRPTTFTNLLDPIEDSLRVVVVSALDRRPLSGATVRLSAGGLEEQLVTDATGQAIFPAPPGGAVEVHVFSAAYDWVSILGTTSRDLLVPLAPRVAPELAGGFSGQMAFSGTGPLSLGIAGLSLTGDLHEIDLAGLLGPTHLVEVNLLGQVFRLPLPAHMSMGLEFQGVPITIKESYHVTGPAGLVHAWGLGGKVELGLLTELLGGIDSLEELVLALFPAFSALRHGVRPAFEVFPLPQVPDANDLDGDGDTAELRPDWANLPDLDLAPGQPQSLALEVDVPPLPSLDGQPMTTAVVVAGGLSSLGLTPLGLTALSLPAGGSAGRVMRLSPAHGGLEVGAYGVVVLGLPPGGGLGVPEDSAALLAVRADLPARLDFAPGFLPFPSGAWDAPGRELIAAGAPGAGLHRLELASAAGRWLVYLPAADTLAARLPWPPEGLTDRVAGARARLTALGLVDDLGFEELVGFDGQDLDRLGELTRATTRRGLD
jgi:hypothetical protein